MRMTKIYRTAGLIALTGGLILTGCQAPHLVQTSAVQVSVKKDSPAAPAEKVSVSTPAVIKIDKPAAAEPQAKNIPAAAGNGTPPSASFGDWQYAGWYGGGMYPALAADPNIEGRLYLGSDVAGMWRTDDRGDHWYFINKGLPSLNIACIAVAPPDSNIVYAGSEHGVVRSDDAGMNWSPRFEKGLVFKKPMSQKAIAVSSSNPDHVYAGSDGGEIFASEDGGKKWNKIGSAAEVYGEKQNIGFVFISPDDSYLIAGLKAGVMKYSFADKNWTKLDPAAAGEPYGDASQDRKNGALAVTAGKRIYWTEDGGTTWQPTSEIVRNNFFRVSAVWSAPGEPKILAGWLNGWSGGPMLSSGSGKSWANISDKVDSGLALNPTRIWIGGFARANAILIDPFNPEIFYYTDSWGVRRSDDNGASWHEIIQGAPDMTGEDLKIDTDGTLLVGTMDDGLLKSSDGGATYNVVLPQRGHDAAYVSGHYWSVMPLGGGNYAAGATPWYDRKNAVFTGNYQTGEYTRVEKELFSRFSYRNTFWGVGYPRAIAKDPADSKKIYLGIDGDEAGGFYYSVDGGAHWTRSAEQPTYLKIYNGLDTDPETGRIYWAACGARGGIYTADAPGEKWKERLFGNYGGAPCFFDLKAAPGGIVYASGAEKNQTVIYISRDHGEHWDTAHSFDEGQAMEAIAIDPSAPQNIFAGIVYWSGKTGGKIMYSGDQGKNWRDISASLPANSGPAAMAVSPKDQMLYVLLYAGGVYKRPLSSVYE